MRKNICNIVPCQHGFNFQFTDRYRNISQQNNNKKQQTKFIENWKITNYITFPPANSL